MTRLRFLVVLVMFSFDEVDEGGEGSRESSSARLTFSPVRVRSQH